MTTLPQLIKSKTLVFSAAITVLSALNGYLGLFNLTQAEQSYALLQDHLELGFQKVICKN